MTGGDVQEGDFVGALFVVLAGHFHRVTSIADIDEVHAFYNAAFIDIQAGNDAFCQSHNSYYPFRLSQKAWASATSRVPS